MKRIIVGIVLVMCLLAGSVSAQTAADTSLKIPYGAFKAAYQWHDSLQVVTIPLYLELSEPESRVRFGFEVIPIGLLHSPNVKENWYVSSNLVLLFGWGAPFLLSQQVFGDSSTAMYVVGAIFSPLLLPTARPRVSFWPTRWGSIWAGYDAHCVLFAFEDGVWVRPQVGLEIRPRKSVGIEIAGIHNNFWSWEGDSRSFGWGIHAALTFDISLATDDNP